MNATMMKKTKRPTHTEQIVINGVPKPLLDELNKMAIREDRSRASLVRSLLTENMSSKRQLAA